MQFEPFDMGVSTADAEHVALEYRDNRLTLTFLDWREQRRVVRFDDVVAHCWYCESEVFPKIRDDTTYQVLDSDLVRRLLECGAVTKTQEVQHYVLCFNAEGVLEVVVGSFQVLE